MLNIAKKEDNQNLMLIGGAIVVALVLLGAAIMFMPKQATTPTTPVTTPPVVVEKTPSINVVCSAGMVLITNTGDSEIQTKGMSGSLAASRESTGRCNVETGRALAAGDTCLYATGAKGSGYIIDPITSKQVEFEC